MSTSTRPTSSLVRPAPAGRATGRGATSSGHGRGKVWPASAVAGAVRWAAVVLLATGVVLMHAVLDLSPTAQATSQATGQAGAHVAATATTTAPAPTTGDTTFGSGHGPSHASPGPVSGPFSSAPSNVMSGESSQESGHDCAHCQGADHTTSLGHLCLAVVGGLLLAGAAAWARRRHRLPALDLDVRLRDHRLVLPVRAVLGVPPWTHLSLAQLSLLRV